tara:strand:+ start:4772 stop:5146 length:375 start_codon:yes stop_codon:yes gene_type:complete
MATFNDLDVGTSAGGTKASYGMQKTSAPLTRVTRFADGFEQRVVFGLPQNQNPKVYTLRFEKSKDDAQKIEDFLDLQHRNASSFNFAPEGESVTRKVVCEQWSKTIPYNNRATINATFREVFEP